MDTISISQLKMNPSKVIHEAIDFPVPVASRNKVKAYLVGKELYEKIASYLENHIDAQIVRKTDFRSGRKFETVAEELGV